MNGVEYYRDRRVDRSQYKGLSFRLRDGVLLSLPACAAPRPRAVWAGVGRPPGRAHAGLYIRQSSVDRTGTQLRTPRAIAATRQQCATTAWRMRNRAYAIPNETDARCRVSTPGLQTQP